MWPDTFLNLPGKLQLSKNVYTNVASQSTRNFLPKYE